MPAAHLPSEDDLQVCIYIFLFLTSTITFFVLYIFMNVFKLYNRKVDLLGSLFWSRCSKMDFAFGWVIVFGKYLLGD